MWSREDLELLMALCGLGYLAGWFTAWLQEKWHNRR